MKITRYQDSENNISFGAETAIGVVGQLTSDLCGSQRTNPLALES